MLVIIGSIIGIGCVLGGYMAMGGKLGVLWQPFEFVIIFGAGVGALVVGNPKPVLKAALNGFKLSFKGPKYTKDDYLELLSMMYSVFKLAKSKGMLALEQHIEKPEESKLFTQFPKFMADHHAMEFLCDYLRLMTLGSENPHEMESLMDMELDVHHAENHLAGQALTNFGDSFPALGIVAAVLGVIKTMGSISEPPEVLGRLIGGALVGTFLGILLSYGIFSPMAAAAKATMEHDSKYLLCMKAGLLAHLQGYAPAVSVEFARKSLVSNVRPTFYEVEEATSKVQSV
ncbi:MAG TPA: flagellar motor stator protein MotA [Ferrovibrio sp.]|jgi:chemotaxis protein MotA|uniref:flagellar motor stator protein MotA n=1 Tax=Ferrovibrio sp. TaxID=1917215 RepID=UPI002B4B324C|nr:flagellar motor stator protein MotA [Ferrovibrio sp.]HLT76964.1 flagellar motor stator protein MotA [Ferrovibrio sp.]